MKGLPMPKISLKRQLQPSAHWYLCLAILVVVLLSVLPTAPALAVGQVGDPAADFNLEDTWGNWHNLQDFRHQKVVLLNMIGFG